MKKRLFLLILVCLMIFVCSCDEINQLPDNETSSETEGTTYPSVIDLTKVPGINSDEKTVVINRKSDYEEFLNMKEIHPSHFLPFEMVDFWGGEYFYRFTIDDFDPPRNSNAFISYYTCDSGLPMFMVYPKDGSDRIIMGKARSLDELNWDEDLSICEEDEEITQYVKIGEAVYSYSYYPDELTHITFHVTDDVLVRFRLSGYFNEELPENPIVENLLHKSTAEAQVSELIAMWREYWNNN